MAGTAVVIPWWRKFTPKQYAMGAAAVVVTLVCIYFYGRIDMEALHLRAQRMNGWAVFAAITLLPMGGFPVSVLHAIAGVRYGMVTGLILVGVSIAIQMLLSYWLVHLAPGFFARKVEPLRRRLPIGAHRAVTIFTFLLPGAPYFAQNYVLPLVGVPLVTYLAWGVPIHFVRSAVGVVFGHMSDDLTPVRIAGFAIYTVAIIGVCGWAFRRLQKEMRFPRRAAGGPKRHA